MSSLEKISCSNYGYRQWKLAEVIPSMARIGYRGIEIVTHSLGWPMGYHLAPFFHNSYIDRLMDTLTANGMQVVCISPGNDFYNFPSGSKDEEVKHVKSEIDLAFKVGAPTIRIQATRLREIPKGVSRSDLIETLADPLARCTDYGKSKGVKLAVETHHGFWASVPENMKDILDAVKSDYLGICLHTLVDSPKMVSALGNKILHLHLSDNLTIARHYNRIMRLRRDKVKDSDIMKNLGITKKEFVEAMAWEPKVISLGEGEIDFKTIFRGLKEKGYSSWWNYEGHSTVDPEDDARKAYTYITKLLKDIGIK